jgi:rfaE bifunctional protein kinase chain/domain
MSRNKKALVIGDLILDNYIIGDINRISPEAPVPVLLQNNHYKVLGGALNVARNLNNLNNDVFVIGSVGNDESSKSMFDLMKKEKINTKNIIIDNKLLTSQKTRFIAQNQQLLRLDVEQNCFTKKNEANLIKKMNSVIKETDFVIISDYNKGVCSDLLLKKTIESSIKSKIRVFIDPKGNNFQKYKNAYCITPNIKETKDVYKSKLDTDKDFELACRYICDTYNIETCIITRGKDGMTVFDSINVNHIKSTAKDVFDVSGAGDTVISTLSTFHTRGKSLIESAQIANLAAQYVIKKFGTTPIKEDALTQYL